VFFSFNFQYNLCFYSINILKKAFKENINVLPIKLEKVIFIIFYNPISNVKFAHQSKNSNYTRIDAIKTREKLFFISLRLSFSTLENGGKRRLKTVVDNNGLA
jgi:hypothetical protein